MAVFKGTNVNDVASGGADDDVFKFGQGGVDNLSGGGGDDSFQLGGALRANDTIDGGNGKDILALKGDYSGGLTLTETTVTNVDVFKLKGSHNDYVLTTNDATVGAGDTLIVRGGNAHSVNFDGSAETDGDFSVAGSRNADTLEGGAGNDVINGNAGADVIGIDAGGSDNVKAGIGDDTISLRGGSLDSTDRINGEGGTDTAILGGDYNAGVTLTGDMLTSIENLVIEAGSGQPVITVADDLLADGQTMNVSVDEAFGIFYPENLNFNGSGELDGNFDITGGVRSDTLVGGGGDDTITTVNGGDSVAGNGGVDLISLSSGADVLGYSAASDSASTTHDTVEGLDLDSDKFDLTFAVTATGTASGSVSQATFDADLAAATNDFVGAHGAMIVTASGGDQSGHSYLVIDSDGSNSYTAGSDLVIDITGYSGTLDTGDFI